ncbi:MAG: flagellar basal body-associated FliL family protein [Roseicyclus sp.]|nr:flagellar basal body-associated FliL family protein [Roseicyclus sp.]MBO6626247.1 flagellar basal body-associated FliL family protein [Roseicyclus sp.]MBO6923567.1 flagellar basal body-associated FliL family protein [Roseicyclus sp.]
MAAAADPDIDEAPKKRGLMMPLLIGLFLAAAAGGGGFWAVTQGPLAGMFSHSETDDEEAHDAAEYTPVAFVPLETLIVSLGSEAAGQHLIVSAELEVDPAYADEVTTLSPRVLDVLNSYLRVIDLRELSEPTSLIRLRAQMLRRVQVVTGDGRVRDLLITQFVVN